MAARERNLKVKSFEFTNPYMGKDVMYEGRYNHGLIDTLFKAILLIDLDKRKYKNEEVTINLLDYKVSSDINIMEGHFATARHGIRRTNIDIDTQQEISHIELHQGVKNEIYFTLDKRTGLLLVEEDKANRVFNRSLLKSFIYSHRTLIYPYIEIFNKKNQGYTISKRSFYRLTALPPTDFFEKIKEFATIQSGIFYIESSERDDSVDVIEKLEEELEENNIDEYDVEIKIRNKSTSGMVKTFEKYFKRMIELQKYDSFALEGKTHSGATKKITPDSITREFDIKVRYNSHGLPKLDDMYKGMKEIILNKNPLEGKSVSKDINLIEGEPDVLEEIQKLAERYNKNKESEDQAI